MVSPTLALAFGMQIARHVAGRNPHAAQQDQRQVGEVLADALALAQRVEARRVHAGGARHVGEFAVHPLRRLDDRLLGIVVLGDALDRPGSIRLLAGAILRRA